MISAMHYHRATFYNLHSENMSIIMPFAEAKFLLDQLAYLLRGATCNSLAIYLSSPEVLALASNFIKGKTVPTLGLEVSEESSEFLIHLIDLFNATSLRLNITTAVSDTYLIQLAGMVDSISISERYSMCFSTMRSSREVMYLAQGILSKRCSRLDISDTFVNFSYWDATCLFYEIHPKKMYLTARTIVDPRIFYHIPMNIVEDEHFSNMNRITVKN
ncbi:hypothetical protein PMAYCL1PPCAC_28424 [Pristionchus mayeri]|uniref:Uncharacterized protein n=1 Tax=Pristionchus mayeri TaxID=1317129 RepID=A0AAN5IB78_9BILA|nr:hypothetical protein PMAYCL1PPCAC_28424 [Pristionchus mayeri]